MIETEKIQFSKKQMFMLQIKMYLKMRRIIFTLYPILVFIILYKLEAPLSIYLILLLLLSIIVLPIYMFFLVYSKKNNNLFQPYILRFEDELIWQINDDNSLYSVRWDSINKLISIGNYFGIFYSKNDYILVDSSKFKGEDYILFIKMFNSKAKFIS